MRFLCLKTDTVITKHELLRTRKNINFARHPNTWTPRIMEFAQARKIYDVPMPMCGKYEYIVPDGHEEIEGNLFQRWKTRQYPFRAKVRIFFNGLRK